MDAVQLLGVVEDEEQAEAKHGHDVSGEGEEEQEEVAVVPSADAVVHPGAVVIKVLQGNRGGTV